VAIQNVLIYFNYISINFEKITLLRLRFKNKINLNYIQNSVSTPQPESLYCKYQSVNAVEGTRSQCRELQNQINGLCGRNADFTRIISSSARSKNCNVSFRSNPASKYFWHLIVVRYFTANNFQPEWILFQFYSLLCY
jgi:hypothetical protein